MSKLRSLNTRPLLALAAVGAFALAAPPAAHAWWRGGVFIGLPPVVVAPPAYYPPPAYYYPPAYYAPPPAYAPPQVARCYAGEYVCPLDQAQPSGTACSCPTNQGRLGGRAG